MTQAVADRRVTVIQGEWIVSRDPHLVLTTILGSCVAACLRDPAAGIGGMNHFLLPETKETGRAFEVERYGVHLMELLVNGLLKEGARRDRLEARIFGGCSFMGGRYAVGARNVAFAEKFLSAEGIRRAGGSTGGEKGRRIEFWPVSGRARQIFLKSAPPVEKPVPPPTPKGGDIELF
ncbi:MAG: chemotaxis protein CheD [Rhodobacteraceae bacterium]|nr:MAG: chemotaxis protein CheD [Paracoccaceae bacterium]